MANPNSSDRFDSTLDDRTDDLNADSNDIEDGDSNEDNDNDNSDSGIGSSSADSDSSDDGLSSDSGADADTDGNRDGSQTMVISSRSDRKRTREQRQGGSDRRQGRDRRDAITGSSDSSGADGDKRGYQFDHDGDVVTNLRRVRHGISKSETIDKGETWSFDGVNLIQTELTRLGTEVSTYADSNADSIFTRIRESFTPFSSGNTPLA